jgi:hypothetical protein
VHFLGWEIGEILREIQTFFGGILIRKFGKFQGDLSNFLMEN